MNNRATLKSVLESLNEIMYLMRISRVNTVLTIQIFSHLFHYISTCLFNRLVSKDHRLYRRYWAEKLIGRLSKGGESGPRISRRLPPPANHAGRVPDTSAQTRHSTVGRHQLQLLRSQLGEDQSVAQRLRSRSSRAAFFRTAMWQFDRDCSE